MDFESSAAQVYPWERADHERFMRLALQEAEAAFTVDEVPIGAVIVRQGTVIGRAHNQREQLQDPTAHAEILAITQAAAAIGSWRLDGCIVYVTLEPCCMCAGAMVLARVAALVYGADDPKAGACRSLYTITDDKRLNHRIATYPGVLAEPCGAILSRFFAVQRAKGKK